ncbi:MAG: hypothetical protein IKX14_04070, partial [Neisseriaceae bacterium]|nr:hypothetical protein [Neisseriaceae bacterium]
GQNDFRLPERLKSIPIGVVGGQECPPYNKTCGVSVGCLPTLRLTSIIRIDRNIIVRQVAGV